MGQKIVREVYTLNSAVEVGIGKVSYLEWCPQFWKDSTVAIYKFLCLLQEACSHSDGVHTHTHAHTHTHTHRQ